MQPPFEITDKILDEHVDKICDIIDDINTQKLTILVGENGTGKSLIRKQLNVRFIKETNKKRNVVRQISMQARTESRADLGALSSCLHDSPWEPTSMATYDMLAKTISNHEFTIDDPYYLVFDEMEIGMSKESILGIVNFVKEKIPYWLENTLGVMVITHSDIVAKELYESFDTDFIDIRYNEINKDFDKWFNRTVQPTNFTWLKDWSNKLFKKVQDRSKPLNE